MTLYLYPAPWPPPQPLPCKACKRDELRFKVMLYDDDQGDCITPEHVFDVLEEDLEVGDCGCITPVHAFDVMVRGGLV